MGRGPHTLPLLMCPPTSLWHYHTLLQDFLFNSPAVGRGGLKLVLTPKSKGKTPAGHVQAETAPASAKSVPRTAGRSRLSQARGAGCRLPAGCR